MHKQTTLYLAEIGRRGGRKSRRHLSSQDAKSMVQVREARRAFKAFYAQCFWSYDPAYTIRKNDVAWVAEGLKKYGGRRGFMLGATLCR